MTKYPHSHHRDWWSKYMLNIDSMIRTKHVFCLKKYLEDYPSPWKFFLDEQLLSVGGKFVLHCNLDITKLPVMLPPFSKQCFDAWSDLNNKVPLSFQEIVNEIIWNNKFLCVDKKSVFRRDLFSIGLLKIADLLSCDNTTTTFSFTNPLLNPEQSFFVINIIDSIPAHLVHNNKRFFVSSNNFSSFRCSHRHYRLKFSDTFWLLF